MKGAIRIIMGVAAVLLAATSCQKDEAFTTSQPQGKRIVSFDASIDGFVDADNVKATLETVIQVKWQDGDSVYVYDNNGKIGGLKVIPKEDARTARLEGEIGETDADSIVLVYSNVYTEDNPAPDILTDNNISIDIATQSSADFPFVLYATSAPNPKDVDFKFATSVMKINGTGLGAGEDVWFCRIENVNAECQLAISDGKGGQPAVTVTGQQGEGYIGRMSTGISESGDGRFTCSVGMVQNGSRSGRKVIIRMMMKNYTYPEYEAAFTASAIKVGASYNSVYAFTEKEELN